MEKFKKGIRYEKSIFTGLGDLDTGAVEVETFDGPVVTLSIFRNEHEVTSVISTNDDYVTRMLVKIVNVPSFIPVFAALTERISAATIVDYNVGSEFRTNFPIRVFGDQLISAYYGLKELMNGHSSDYLGIREIPRDMFSSDVYFKDAKMGDVFKISSEVKPLSIKRCESASACNGRTPIPLEVEKEAKQRNCWTSNVVDRIIVEKACDGYYFSVIRCTKGAPADKYSGRFLQYSDRADWSKYSPAPIFKKFKELTKDDKYKIGAELYGIPFKAMGSSVVTLAEDQDPERAMLVFHINMLLKSLDKHFVDYINKIMSIDKSPSWFDTIRNTVWPEKGDCDGNIDKEPEHTKSDDNRHGYSEEDLKIMKKLKFPVQILLGVDANKIFFDGSVIAIAVNNKVVDHRVYSFDKSVECITPRIFDEMINYVLEWVDKSNIAKSVIISETLDPMAFVINKEVSKAVSGEGDVCNLDMIRGIDSWNPNGHSNSMVQVQYLEKNLESIMNKHYVRNMSYCGANWGNVDTSSVPNFGNRDLWRTGAVYNGPLGNPTPVPSNFGFAGNEPNKNK